MSGKLLLAARKDAANFLKNGGFQQDIFFINKSTLEEIKIRGIHTKHWIKFDSNGAQINSKNAHLLIKEEDLKQLGFEPRNTKTGNVSLLTYRVRTSDSTGIEKNYVINETYPSETFGLITIILGDYKDRTL